MLLKSLDLTNFRCFKEFHIDFNDKLTVIVGQNGCGKSTILEAAAIAVGTFTAALDDLPNYGIKKEDAHLSYFNMGSNIDVQPQYPVRVTANGQLDNSDVSWIRSLDAPSGKGSRGTLALAKEVKTIAEKYQERFRKGDTTLVLPIIAYYGTGRLWAQHKEKKDDTFAKNTRINGYIDNLDGAANNKLMLRWFKKMTVQQAQRHDTIPEYQAVCKAMSQCFKSITGFENVEIQYNLDTDDIDVIYNDDNGKWVRIPVSRLSDGYKCTLSLIADIAYRMALLNPQFFDNVLKETNGVVLIDEIDLHLHPEWQTRILSDLTEIFPRVQFIVSTHAPSVINSVKSENLVILENDKARVPCGEIYGKDTNTIVSGIMGSKERPKIVIESFEHFYKYLDENDLDSAKKQISKLEQLIGYDDSEVASLHTKLKLAKIKRSKK